MNKTTRAISLLGLLWSSLALVACGGGGGGSSTSTPMVDSYGVTQSSSFDGGVSSAAGINGAAADGTVLANAPITITDSAGHSVSATTNSNGIYHARIDGFVPPLVGVVTKPDGSRWFSPGTSAPVARSFIVLNLTGLTDKLASDVVSAAGQSGSSRLTPTLLAANSTALAQAKANLNSNLSSQITAAGLSTSTFDPVSTLLTNTNTGYDQLLNGLAISNTASTPTVIGTRYSLGGSISGLGSASGLSLKNGNDTVFVSAGATSFAFSRLIAPGASYSVSVASQPSGLTCSVNNGSGTMGTAALTNVAVVCSTSVASLGGSVSGLGSASGLVLANGSQTVSVPANAGSFTFPNNLTLGASYWVTVQTQPNGATCAVNSGGGTVTSIAPITSVQVQCVLNTYPLSGSVSGLSTSGLVLGITAQSVNVPANAVSWSFPAGVAVGVNYNVVVRAQPVGATCSVANGSGTMGASAVNSVTVSCSSASYSLGGSISGLTGSGLVLSALGQSLTVAANATQFTFATPVAAGTAYNVQVQTQPTGQTCSVSNGSGSITGSAVSNVQISCSSSATTLGGSVSGLTGSGLVVASNGQTLAIPVPATGTSTTFIFPQALAYGTPYDVTVPTQPTNQYCSVGNGKGSMAGLNVSNVQLNCGPGSFALSGTANGLLGPLTLVVSSTGDTAALTVAKPGFSFATLIPVGTRYRVYSQFPALRAYACNAADGTLPPGGVSLVLSCFTQYAHTLTVSGLASGTSLGLSMTFSYPTGSSPDQSDTMTQTFTASNGTLTYYLPVGASYSYGITAQPASGSCAISPTGTGSGSQTTNGSAVKFSCQ